MMHVHTPIFQSIISFLVLTLQITNISAEAVCRFKEEIIWIFYLNFHPSFAINCLGHANFLLSSVERYENNSYWMLVLGGGIGKGGQLTFAFQPNYLKDMHQYWFCHQKCKHFVIFSGWQNWKIGRFFYLAVNL